MSELGAQAAPTTLTIAAFDFDGTVTRGGSVFSFLSWVRGRRRVLTAVTLLAPSLLRAAIAGGSTADDTKERLFERLLCGVGADGFMAAGRTFARRHLDRRLRPEVARRIEWHRAQGHRLVLVSASPEAYVRPAGERLGVDAVLATRLAVDASGLLTGRYDGRNCRGTEKYGRLVGWMRTEGALGPADGQPRLWAYGNSRGDLRLLEAADVGVDAGRLGRLGRLRRFPSLQEVARAG